VGGELAQDLVERHFPAIGLAGRQPDLGRQGRHRHRQFRGQRLAALLEDGQHRPLDLRQPASPVGGHAIVLDDPHQPPAVDGGDLGRAGLVHHGRQLDRQHEDRPAHTEHAQHGAVVVLRRFELRGLEAGHARPGREVHRSVACSPHRSPATVTTSAARHEGARW
jgi:hypothetical protein